MPRPGFLNVPRVQLGPPGVAVDEEKEIRLFANLCEVQPSIIEELDESDYATLQKAYMDFFKSEGISDEPSLFSPK